MNIGVKFKRFCENLEFSDTELQTINGRFEKICSRLNADFWNLQTTHGGRYVGSVGRKTANSWESDIDMLFVLPYSTYLQYNNYTYNGQSALLQAVKNSLIKTYPNSILGGDGQVVKISFSNFIHFEVLPAFENNDGTFTYPDSNGGGQWKITNPIAEINAIDYGQILTSNNLINLCRMLRAWKYYNSVPIGGLLLDTFAYNFLVNWHNKDQSYFYYDFMTRDFFSYLKNTIPYTTRWYALGSSAVLEKNGDFINKAKKAYELSLEAIENENNGNIIVANLKWKEIYGSRFTV